MRILVVAVGKIKAPELRVLIDDYIKRITRYAQVSEIELKDETASKLAARIEKLTPPRARLVALEILGKRYSSTELAAFISTCEVQAISALVFLIGGAYGLPAQISAQADLKLSLSPMTLPHRLARLFLVEQLYRAFSINRNEPYAHE
ncbi:MAG: 23S rRNA (pseudouridine(1915)-N(3))-methyltransferase RlmH [Myxococcales bacterium]|nr:23S rRNA (pseudouridine(1915)-N(3))-methyltransferase RlmH [Myxococcales bacterium]